LCLDGRLRSGGLLFMLSVSTVSGWAQALPSTPFGRQFDDTEVLASCGQREDVSCQVTPYKPKLGFDLRFHSNYRVTVPIKILANNGGWLQVLMRVTPAANSDTPVYLSHRYSVPDFEMDTRGKGDLEGG
jgi:hypothetical protein